MSDIKTITLLGASGFIGRRLVPRLAERGMILRLPLRDLALGARFKALGRVGQIAYFPASVRNEAALGAAMEGADAVINLIGIRREDVPGQFQALHVEMAARLARLAYQKGVKRLIHLSSFAANPMGPSPYARTKAASEEAIMAFFSDATLLRPHPVFGAGDRLLTPFAKMARLSRLMPLPQGGDTELRPAYVEDVVAAILAALDLPESRGRVYDLSGAGTLALQEIGEMVFKVAGKDPRPLALPLWATRLLGTSFREFRTAVGIPSEDKALLPFQALGVIPTPLEEVLAACLAIPDQAEKELAKDFSFSL